ncbi:toxin glutamine deamidase domain-containing protein [Actinoallomurus bryophytorum]|uniref:toxin glutamine deamidase domain-containing protein n=1 Tax=Actinoallomurus bryophytorum TaxID=1490222 RepID=UPI001154A3A8|nr:toxin glutamine deamidase domain-containing protein [Actinoallomurus bryophytorum]
MNGVPRAGGLFADAIKTFFRSSHPMRVGAEDAAAHGGADAAGPDLLLRLRPSGISRFSDSIHPPSPEHALLIRASHGEVAAILDAARGRRLTQGDIDRLLHQVNPTGSGRNCLECSLALDDMLARRAVVAGPCRETINTKSVSQMLDERSLYALPGLRADELRVVESQLTSFGGGARGIILRLGRTSEGVPSHTYNVANINGKILYLDGQVGKSFARHPARGQLSTYNFYRAA